MSYLLYACAQSYTTLDEKTFYVMPNWGNSQFFSLDLTQSWDAAKAPLQGLPAPPMDDPYLQLAALVVNYDKNSLLYLNSHRTTSVYSITTKEWKTGARLTNPNATERPRPIYGNQVAIDPSTGIAYIPSSEHFDNFPMYTYNTLQGSTTNVTKTIVPGVSIPFEGYSAVWSTVRKSVLFYGGKINGFTPVGLMEYQPSSNQWTSVESRGATTPGNADFPCMASASNGMKMVLLSDAAPPYSVFILDVKTLVWTKGAELKSGQQRNSAPCTIIGDYFIVVGGAPTSSTQGTLQPVIVYNIKLDQWTDSYEAPHTPSASTGVGSPSTTETASPVADQGQSSGEGMTLGTKIGIIAGGSSILLILLTCGAFLIRQRNMHKSRQATQLEHDSKSPSSSPNGHLRPQGTRNPQILSFKAPPPSPHSLLKPQVARKPQHHSSSIPTVAIQQWQCVQQERDLQYIPPPPSVPTKPAVVQYPQHGLQDERGNYDDRLDHRAFYHDQRRHDFQEDPDYYNHTADYSAMYRNRYPNDPQPSYGDYDDEAYPTEYQNPRMNAPQEYGHLSTEKDVSFYNKQRRLDPQDHTRSSTASQLEFYQARPFNNPQDYGNKVGRDVSTPHQEIRRIRGQQEVNMLRRQSLERVRLVKEAKISSLAGRADSVLPRRQY